MKLQQRQARETGICPVRRELYSQCFGEWVYMKSFPVVYRVSSQVAYLKLSYVCLRLSINFKVILSQNFTPVSSG